MNKLNILKNTIKDMIKTSKVEKALSSKIPTVVTSSLKTIKPNKSLTLTRAKNRLNAVLSSHIYKDATEAAKDIRKTRSINRNNSQKIKLSKILDKNYETNDNLNIIPITSKNTNTNSFKNSVKTKLNNNSYDTDKKYKKNKKASKTIPDDRDLKFRVDMAKLDGKNNRGIESGKEIAKTLALFGTIPAAASIPVTILAKKYQTEKNNNKTSLEKLKDKIKDLTKD